MSTPEHDEKTTDESLRDSTTETAENGAVWHFTSTDQTVERNIQPMDTDVAQVPYQQSIADINICESQSKEIIPKDDALVINKESTEETFQDSSPVQPDIIQCAYIGENKMQKRENEKNGTNIESSVSEQGQENPAGGEFKENPCNVPDNNSEICSSTDVTNTVETENVSEISETEKCDKDSNQCERSVTQGNDTDCWKGARPKANKKKPGIDQSHLGGGPEKPSKKEKNATEKEKGSRWKNRFNFKQESCEDFPDERKTFEYFWQSHSVFSQWHYSEFFVDGFNYTCAEQYMMHQKAVLMGDNVNAEIIMSLYEPREMKNVGRYVQNFKQDLWDEHCMEIVKKGNIAKFSQNKEMKEKLFATHPKTLVEASPLDKVWGIGLAKDDKRAWNQKTWKGRNLLGFILTDVREELMKDAGLDKGRDSSSSEKNLETSTNSDCSTDHADVVKKDQDSFQQDIYQAPYKDEESIKQGDSNITPKDEGVLEHNNKTDTPN